VTNVEALDWIVGEEGTAGQFVEEEKWRTSSRFYPSVSGNNVSHSIDSMELPRVDLIKIDAEGSEIDVLIGAKKTLDRCRPLVLMEFNSFAIVYYRDISPRQALRIICNSFSDVQYYDRHRDGELTKLVDQEAFLLENYAGKFVDDLLCTV
jgi:hypothetical protein